MYRLGIGFWLTIAVLTIAYVVAYFVVPRSYDANGLAECATLVTFFGAGLFILIWTVLGLTGRAKWWRQEHGTVVVALAFGYIPQTGVLAFAIVFRHGLINTPFTVWMYVGGLLMSAFAMICACSVWLRTAAHERRSSQDAGSAIDAD